MRLFGTVTSPYVRRVRVVAQELGVDYELVDVSKADGQAALRAVNPIWKIPAIEWNGQQLADSRCITEHLLRTKGPGPLPPIDPDDLRARNIYTVIDGVQDALINAFYLARDGATADQVSYVRKQHERAAAGMAWLEGQVQDVWLTKERSFGLHELALTSTVEWMSFRDTFPVERHPALLACAAHHGARQSLMSTRPPAQ